MIEILVAGANIRSGPGTDGDVVDVLKMGDRAELIKISEDGNWFNILLPNGGSGWVGSSVAEVVEETQTAISSENQDVAATGTIEQDVEVSPDGILVSVQENSINLRSGPGVESEVIGTGLQGETYEVVGRTTNSNWYNIVTDSGRAWLAASVVREVVGGSINQVKIASTIPARPVVIETSVPPTDVVVVATMEPTAQPAFRLPDPPASGGCCKYCRAGKACGDGCIPKNSTCHKVGGCACDG